MKRGRGWSAKTVGDLQVLETEEGLALDKAKMEGDHHKLDPKDRRCTVNKEG